MIGPGNCPAPNEILLPGLNDEVSVAEKDEYLRIFSNHPITERGAIFWWRGLGIVVYTHALYNVAVILPSHG